MRIPKEIQLVNVKLENQMLTQDRKLSSFINKETNHNEATRVQKFQNNSLFKCFEFEFRDANLLLKNEMTIFLVISW